MKNYANETIPDFNHILSEIKGKVQTVNKFKFTALFDFKDPEWRKNDKEIERIAYNSKVYGSKFSEEELINKEPNEIKGVYILYEKGEPVYVGISRSIIRRLKQHFISKSHYSASLVYLMARHEYDESNDQIYLKKRSEFPFEEARIRLQQKMRNDWEISIIPVENNYEMYLLEFYLACELKTKWNSFETH